jgi:hypothetical protein
MTDIDLNGIKISYGGKSTLIPFDPPLKSLREARERLVQMDKDALSALGTYILEWGPRVLYLPECTLQRYLEWPLK